MIYPENYGNMEEVEYNPRFISSSPTFGPKSNNRKSGTLELYVQYTRKVAERNAQITAE